MKSKPPKASGFRDSVEDDVVVAAKKFQDWHGRVSPAFAFRHGARWALENSKPIEVAALPRARQVDLKAHPDGRKWLAGKTVLIRSVEHGAFWRSAGSGYTVFANQAGKYRFEDAWDRTSHCGPEKDIEYIVVEP